MRASLRSGPPGVFTMTDPGVHDDRNPHHARRSGRTGRPGLRRRLRHYTSPSLLVLDEVGYMSYGQGYADLLFQVVSQRYQRRSTIVSTNRVFTEWSEVFPNATSIIALIAARRARDCPCTPRATLHCRSTSRSPTRSASAARRSRHQRRVLHPATKHPRAGHYQPANGNQPSSSRSNRSANLRRRVSLGVFAWLGGFSLVGASHLVDFPTAKARIVPA